SPAGSTGPGSHRSRRHVRGSAVRPGRGTAGRADGNFPRHHFRRRAQCWPGGATPRNPPHALRAPRWYFADCVGPGGRPPGTPRMRSAPARWYFAAVLARGATPRKPPNALRAPRWYFADTPAAHPAQGPVRWAGNGRLAVGPAVVLADSTGHSPEPSARVRWAGSNRLAVTRLRY